MTPLPDFPSGNSESARGGTLRRHRRRQSLSPIDTATLINRSDVDATNVRLLTKTYIYSVTWKSMWNRFGEYDRLENWRAVGNIPARGRVTTSVDVPMVNGQNATLGFEQVTGRVCCMYQATSWSLPSGALTKTAPCSPSEPCIVMIRLVVRGQHSRTHQWSPPFESYSFLFPSNTVLDAGAIAEHNDQESANYRFALRQLWQELEASRRNPVQEPKWMGDNFSRESLEKLFGDAGTL